MKVITTALLLLCLKFNTYAQCFEMSIPLNANNSYISMHFGNVKIDNSDYKNESVTFATPINSTALCNVDSAIVKNIFQDEGVFTVFLERNGFTIVLGNLKKITVKKGDNLTQGKPIGIVAKDEMQNTRGQLELMLFKKNKIVNPELYLKVHGEVMVLR
jgi:murein DD-endopeptidase MepM/ murein hydrolase activator NlpD